MISQGGALSHVHYENVVNERRISACFRRT